MYRCLSICHFFQIKRGFLSTIFLATENQQMWRFFRKAILDIEQLLHFFVCYYQSEPFNVFQSHWHSPWRYPDASLLVQWCTLTATNLFVRNIKWPFVQDYQIVPSLSVVKVRIKFLSEKFYWRNLDFTWIIKSCQLISNCFAMFHSSYDNQKKQFSFLRTVISGSLF